MRVRIISYLHQNLETVMLASNCSNDPIEVYVEKDIYLKNKGTKENEEVEK